MAQRWIIHSRDRTLGPWTGAQVRDELRAGRIDPFDMVSQENSSIKRPLVEVDDIFQSSRVQMAEIVQEVKYEAAEKADQQATVISQSPERLAEASGEPEAPSRPRQFQALAAEVNPTPQRPAKKSGGRNYLVTDSTSRSFGPMSSHDVVDMWQKGVIDARSIVQRKDQPRKISIQKFVSFYERAAPSGIAFLTDETQNSPSYRYGSKASTQSPMAWFVVLMTLVALGFLGLTIYQSHQNQLRKHKILSRPVNRFDLKANEDLAGRIAPMKKKEPQAVTPQKPIESPAAASQSSGVRAPAPKQRAFERKTPSAHKRSEARRQQRQRSNPLPARLAPARLAAPPAVSRPSRQMASRGPTSNTASSGTPSLSSGWEDGKTITISGYKFSSAALGVCEGKCKIPMSGPQGPVTAVFFKQALGSSFSGKSSGITITGILRKNANGDWQMIVSSAR